MLNAFLTMLLSLGHAVSDDLILCPVVVGVDGRSLQVPILVNPTEGPLAVVLNIATHKGGEVNQLALLGVLEGRRRAIIVAETYRLDLPWDDLHDRVFGNMRRGGPPPSFIDIGKQLNTQLHVVELERRIFPGHIGVLSLAVVVDGQEVSRTGPAVYVIFPFVHREVDPRRVDGQQHWQLIAGPEETVHNVVEVLEQWGFDVTRQSGRG